MKLIIESGATKTEWTLLGDAASSRFITPGVNFAHTGSEVLTSVLSEASRKVDFQAVGEVFVYGAGLFEPNPEILAAFPSAKVEFGSDLLASARALFGSGAGIAAILGTGSNTGFYDGSTVSQKVRSGGFILGDEGSASVLGKLFISDFLKGCMPEALAREFSEKYDSDYLSIVKAVYRSEAPARYLGSFAPFIVESASRYDYSAGLIDLNLRNFFSRALSKYNCGAFEVGISGSFAAAVSARIEAVAKEFGIRISAILASPSEELVNYHRNV